MIRPLLSLTLGAIAIIGVAAVWLAFAVPSHGAECIRASWYGVESCRPGRPCVTANGDRFTGNDMTAAHRTLPFGTKLRVTYKGKSVVVRVNDRGPFVKGRSLDLSRAAAAKLGMIRAGVVIVCVTRL